MRSNSALFPLPLSVSLPLDNIKVVLSHTDLYVILFLLLQTHDVQAMSPFGHDLVMSPMTLHNGCDNVTSQRSVMTLRQRYDVTSS